MNYEKRFKRFVGDLLVLIQRHINEWDEAERGLFDFDEIMERFESDFDKQTEPVIYSQNKEKPSKRKK